MNQLTLIPAFILGTVVASTVWGENGLMARAGVVDELRAANGDLARIDEDGYIFIEGRRSDLIKSGAYRIHPQEIEDVILELDGVAEAAVIGCPDAMMGEVPVAFYDRSLIL